MANALNAISDISHDVKANILSGKTRISALEELFAGM